MGWTGIYKTYDKNIDNIKHGYLNGKDEDEHFWYRGITQRGSSVYVLYQRKLDNEYFVICYLCQTTRCRGYREFMYKDIDAVRSHCYDFPKKWVALLNQNDKDVQEYIKGREAYETKKKLTFKAKLNDIFRCTSNYDITWGDGYTIKANEPFFIKYTSFGCDRKRYFKLCYENGRTISKRIKRKTFEGLKEKVLIKQEG